MVPVELFKDSFFGTSINKKDRDLKHNYTNETADFCKAKRREHITTTGLRGIAAEGGRAEIVQPMFPLTKGYERDTGDNRKLSD